MKFKFLAHILTDFSNGDGCAVRCGGDVIVFKYLFQIPADYVIIFLHENTKIFSSMFTCFLLAMVVEDAR